MSRQHRCFEIEIIHISCGAKLLLLLLLLLFLTMFSFLLSFITADERNQMKEQVKEEVKKELKKEIREESEQKHWTPSYSHFCASALYYLSPAPSKKDQDGRKSPLRQQSSHLRDSSFQASTKEHRQSNGLSRRIGSRLDENK
jgi:hypothetical protein